MGDRNQYQYLTKHIPKVDGPVLEVGSRAVNGMTTDYRKVYPDGFVGLDLFPGEGVDVVADLTKGVEPGQEGRYALVICCSVLEHVEDPWAMARSITKLLRPGGKAYISVPWVWRYHAYPDDYWRFTWSGIRKLFPDLEWNDPEFSTTREGEFFPAKQDADNNMATVIEGRKFLPYLELHMIGTR